ncbi:MFS transporter [Streptomyces europaeiscabiei]|uniref:MFS transporter n=1 Tax=Streptomyces europaeiscabiei TaxID=146819 RepID=UPI0029A800A8|nr:MFS transporter [Streptomyces europaeiscabiei]MDX3581877.1 MFS transporter [Streptomyces europaeiscabiei]MDX3612732.1 MFS transporter [Streptomyces europaeiscabiei]MDX3636554.1 MFS transporter [Streptomyces europaeiscabiei]MDX3654639.1 MFS transporter [Streptomyces europaeiscabiei]
MSATSPRPSYAAVLRIPYARRTFAAVLVGRLSYGMVPVAVLLAVTRTTGSYAVAGTVMALFGATSVFLSPVRAGLVDRYGPRRVLLPMASLYAGLLGALAVASWRPGASGAVAAAAGACTPPLGPTMRTVWSELAADQGLLRRAYSLDGVAEELLFVSGPLVVGGVVQFAAPAAALVVGALLVVAGTYGFVTSPAVTRMPGRGPAPKEGARGRRPRVVAGIVPPVVAAGGVGLSLGALDLLVLAFAEQQGHGDDVVAWIFAALSAGSAVGGLLYGAVEWCSGARVRLALLTGGLGLTLAGAGLAPDLAVLTGAIVCAGLFVAPALTTAYLVADASAPPVARTRSGAWVNTAVNAGISAGAATSGLLVAHFSPALGFALAGGAALLAASALGAGRLRGRAPEPPRSAVERAGAQR